LHLIYQDFLGQKIELLYGQNDSAFEFCLLTSKLGFEFRIFSCCSEQEERRDCLLVYFRVTVIQRKVGPLGTLFVQHFFLKMSHSSSEVAVASQLRLCK
jgi:hypothetical protein